MLGLSLQKLAVFVGIVATLWTVFRIIRQVGAARQRHRAGLRPERPGKAVAQDMKECPVCGTYVAPAAALDCGRPRCPYPRAAT